MNSSTISIHAPPRGATFPPFSRPSLINYFNSRPSARGDQGHTVTSKIGKYFNSRPSARGDVQNDAMYDYVIRISIHAPPRGATALGAGAGALIGIFQFTPLREGRRAL